MVDLATRLQELSPAAKRAFLGRLLSLQKAKGKVAPLSYAQQRLWFLEQLVSGNPFYNESSAVRILYPLDTAALEKTLNEIVRRHETLRTIFVATDGQPLQCVLPPQPLAFPLHDLTHLPETQREAESLRLVNEHACEPFNIAKGPLLRVALIRLGASDHIFVVTMHHIVCDGWSTKVFFDELRELYAAFVYGRPSPLSELPIQYTDFSAWQREWLQGSALEEQLEFWRGRLAGLPTLELPADKPRPAVPTFSGAREPIAIPPEVNRALESLCEQISVTPFMALLAAFQALLQRYTGQDDVAVGSPVANRNRAELEKLIGFFVNTLVMRTDLSGNPTFRELLRRVREVALSAYSHQDLPFERLVEELQPTRDPSRNPLFQVTFQILSDRESKETIEQLRVVEVEQLTSKFDLRCDLWTRDGGLTGYLEYSTDLFEHQTIKLMARNFEALVSAMVADPDRRISSAPLSAGEQEKLREWNNTTRTFPNYGYVHERFEKFAETNPDQVVIVDGAESISYRDLNRRANQLAHYLKRRGIKPGCFVAILLDRSIDLIVSLVATLKTGASYIPLDPSYPRERLSIMLRESFAPLVVTKSEFAESIPSFIPQIQIDKSWDVIAKEEVCNLPSHSDQSLAYVIFTSGSTGKPRGVEVLHSGLNNLVNWHQQEYQITAKDRATLYASPGFDASVWEIWPYLSAGASLYIPDAETHASPSHLARWMAEAGITISFLPTPIAEAFVEMELPNTLRLRVLLTGGDKLRHYPHSRLPFRFVNHYGPTENSVVATSCTVETSATLAAPPIGKPIANVRVYILDRYGHPVPIGAKGELYLGGAGLARGYLNQASLTKEKFISTNLDPHLGSRLYRTGDLVRYRNDGNLEFHGRVDCQMKIRGYRVEPGEIEAALDQYPAVQKSLAVLQENGSGEKVLAAYLTSQPTEDADVVAGLQSERVNEWQQIYEQLYLSNYEERDHSFDIIGWNSSYTGQPLSRAEMDEQVTATAKRISSLGAKSILEIGCGTGLLLMRLAGDCERYVGTDFSKAALAEVEAQVRDRNWSHVELYHRRADEFLAEDAHSFDVVVLNSVAQYFPHMDYLAQVLETACGMLRPGGFVFVGDVRSLPLQPFLQAGVEVARADDDCTVEELRARMVRRSKSDPELIVDPQFFHTFATRVKEISGLATEVRRGWQQNELTRFRYDVLLQVTDQMPSSSESIAWQHHSWEEFGTIAALRNYLDNTSAPVVVTGIPNARLSTERLKLQKLEQAEGSALLSTLNLDDEPAESAVEPEQLWALEDELDYRIQVGFSEATNMCALDVKCVPRFLLSSTAILDATSEASSVESAKPWSSFGNEVLKQPSEQYMTQRLRQHLRQLLPEYMVPSRFIWVANLPVTANGKLDRAALPSNGYGSHSVAAHTAPKNDVEAKLVGIWEEVLGLENVNVNENFFDLGGHSLLLVRLHSKLTQHFETSLSIIDLFRLPSISSLARALIAEHASIASTTFI